MARREEGERDDVEAYKWLMLSGEGIDRHNAEALAADPDARFLSRRSPRRVEAESFGADLGRTDEIRDLIDAIDARWGRLDVLVNSAAIWPRIPFEKVTADQVRECFEINALATFVAPNWESYRFYNWQMSVTRKPEYTLGALVDRASWLPIVHALPVTMSKCGSLSPTSQISPPTADSGSPQTMANAPGFSLTTFSAT